MKRLLYILLLFPVFVHAQSITIYAPSSTICNGSPVLFTAFETGIAHPHYHWKVNGANAGTDSLHFVRNTPATGDSIICLLTNSIGDTVFATSNSIIMTVQAMPHADTITGSDTACITGTITALSDAVPGGVWSASNTSASISGSGVLSGNAMTYYGYFDTIYYVVTNTCGADTASVAISVFSLPHIIWGGYYGVCTGQSVDISSDYGNPNFEYASNNHASVSNDIAWGGSPGLDTIYGVSINYCGSDTNLSFVSVYLPQPPPVVTPVYGQSTTVCVGATLALSDSTSGRWSVSNGNAVIGADGITGVSPGLDTIIAIVEFGICNSGPLFAYSPPYVITIDPPGAILNPGVACAGTPVVLYDSTTGGVWSDSNPAVATVKAGTIQPGTAVVTTLSPGVDTVYYTLPGGCTVNTPVIVNPSPAPITGNDVYCTGEPMNLADTGMGAWSMNDSSLVYTYLFSNRIIITGTKVGMPTITYSYNTGCAVTKQIRIVNCDKEVNIFPNPAGSQLIIEADTSYYHSYTIINCLGQIIAHGQITQLFTEVDSGPWAAGIYMVRMDGEETYTSRLLKE